MTKTKIALGISIALMMGVNSSYADDADLNLNEEQQKTEENNSDNSIRTKGIEVSATRVKRELLQVPLSVSVITADDIQKTAPATIADALKDVPSVSIVSDGSQGIKRVGLRGENPYRTVVLVDGQRISEHKSMDGAPLLISPSQVDRIEIIRGPASVLYGSDAIGGVINIITKKAKEKPVEVELGMSYDSSNKGFSEYAGVSGKTNGIGYRFGASSSDNGDLRTAESTIEGTSFRQKNFDGMLSYDINDHVTVGINGEYYDGSYNFTTDTSDYDFTGKVPVWKRSKVNVFTELNDLNDYLARVRIDAYHQRTKKIMDHTIDMGMAVINAGSDNSNISNGVTAQTEWQLGANNYLIAGAGFENDDLAAQTPSETLVYPTSVMTISTKSLKDFHGVQRTAYGFLSNETQLPMDLTATYGLRYTHVKSEFGHSSSDKNTTISSPYGGSTTNILTADNFENSSNSRTVFNFGLVYSGLEDQAIRFNFGQGFRAPLMQERYITTTMGGATVYGNPDLKAETSNSFELGYRFNSDTVNTDLSAFYSIADNYISSKPISSADTTLRTYYNVEKAKTFGLEGEISYNFKNGITPYATLTFMRRKYEYNDGVIDSTYNSNTPKLTVRSGLRYTHDFGLLTLNLDGYARMQTNRKETTNSSDTAVTNTYAGFTTANIESSVSFGDNRQYSVGLAWLNINDKEYYLEDYLAEAGSHVVLTFNAKF